MKLTFDGLQKLNKNKIYKVSSGVLKWDKSSFFGEAWFFLSDEFMISGSRPDVCDFKYSWIITNDHDFFTIATRVGGFEIKKQCLTV